MRNRFPHPQQPPRLGIDIGRVIIGGEGQDTQFLDGDEALALAVPPVTGAFAAIAALVAHFEGRVWLVSKAGPRVQARTLRWFDERGFYSATGIDPTHVRFCRERRDKADHARKLGLTHFIDDRQDVLGALVDVVPYRYLFGPQSRPDPRLRHVADWSAVLAALLP